MGSNQILKRFDLKGKVAVITGAGGELCGAMAEALGGMGVSVAVLDLRLDKAEARARSIIKAGGIAAPFRCDVLDVAEIKQCCENINGLCGPPDFLINGAGGNDPKGSTATEFHPPPGSGAGVPPVTRASRPRTHQGFPPLPIGWGEGRGEGPGSFFHLDPPSLRSVFDLNFFGTFLVTQVFSRPMVERGSGAIVNISSMSAFRPLTKVVAYSAAKAAVSNFTQWLAVHFSHTGVRVN